MYIARYHALKFVVFNWRLRKRLPNLTNLAVNLGLINRFESMTVEPIIR